MSLAGKIKYIGGVELLGKSMLRVERLRLESRLRQRWKSKYMESPLKSSPRLKELISRHYLRGRFANGALKTAWVTSGAPVEALTALGFLSIYPENHGAICGIRRRAEELCVVAEEAGYSRDICSYARTDFGSVISGKTPVGKLPKPDLLVCCTNICQTVLHWYRVLAHRFGAPLVIIDTPFLYGEASSHAVTYVQKQIEDSIPVMEKIIGRSLDYRRLCEVTRFSRDACELWMRIIESARAKPAPITAFDQFIHLAPIVEMRGEAFTVDYYASLLNELEDRVLRRQGALKKENKRLLWDNLPIWFRVRWMSELLAERNTSMVASTYTNAWAELAGMIDPNNPIESSARVHLHPILNRNAGHKLATIKKMASDFDVDGVILHSDRSCKPYSIGQVSQRDHLSVKCAQPALLIEADHNDPRSFSEEQARNRIEAFLEMLGA